MKNPPPIIIAAVAGLCLYLAVTDPSQNDLDIPLPESIQALTPARLPSDGCQKLTSFQLRELVTPFVPAPGHSYEFRLVPVAACQQLPDYVRSNGTRANRFLYKSEDGVPIALFVENDRVIGYELFPQIEERP